MNISNRLNRFWYWLRGYYLILAPNSEPYLRYQASARLEKPPSGSEIRERSFFGSRAWAIGIALVVLFVGVFSLLAGPQWSWDVPNEVSQYVGTLWRVQTGLLSIGFVVVVLLMQVLSGRDHLSSNLYDEYLQRSYILHVALLGLATIAVMGATAFFYSYDLVAEEVVARTTVLNSALFVLNLIAIGFVYRRIVHFITPGHSIKLNAELLKRNLQRNLNQQILEALAQHVLISKSQGIGFGYRPTLPREDNPQVVAYPLDQKPLRVQDVDLQRLKRLGGTLDRGGTTGAKGWIRARPGKTLSLSNPAVGYLRSDAPTSAADRLIDCFVTEEGVDERSGWEASVKDLRDLAHQAIEEFQPTKLSDLLDIYKDVLDHYARYVDQYDSEVIALAFDRPLSIADYWRPDSVLHRDIKKLAGRAIRTDDEELTTGILYLPIRIIRIAQSLDNQDLYKQFAGIFVRFYDESQQLPTNSDIRGSVVTRSWRHLRDYARRMESRHLDRSDRPRDIKEHAPYAVHTLEVFGKLIKRAVDYRDYDSFDTFTDEFDALFDDAARTRRSLHSEKLRLERERSKDLEAKEKTEQTLQVLKSAESALEEIKRTKSLVRFGIGAWILDLYRRKQIGEDLFDRLIEKPVSQFGDLEELYQVYVQALESSTQERFQWGFWDSERREEESGFVTTDAWLRRFYVVKGLQTIRPSSVGNVDIPPSSRISVGEIADLQNVCEDILERGHPLRDSDGLQERVDAFIQLHEEAYRRQEEKESDQLIEAEIDQNRIDSFIRGFLNQWEENNLDRLIEPFTAVEASFIGEETPPEGSQVFNLDRLVSKKPFTGQLPEDRTLHLGEEYGRGLGQAERTRLFNALREALPSRITTVESLSERLGELLEDSGIEINLLLIGTRVIVINMRGSGQFVPERKGEHAHSDLPGYEGRFGNVPVCTVPTDSETVLAVDVTDGLSVRRLRQEETEPFQLSIDEVTEEKAQELLIDQPSLGEDFNSEAEAIRHLRQRVLVRGIEHIDFEFEDDAGIVIEIEDGTGK